MEENKQENINCVWLTLTEFCLFIMIFKIYINNIFVLKNLTTLTLLSKMHAITIYSDS